MKRIEFKNIPKALIKEGITIELLDKVQESGCFSPAMLQAGDEPVNLVRANNTSFWVQLEDGSFLKDHGKLMTFDTKTCIIARSRYYLLFSETITAMDEARKAEAIEKEIDRELAKLQHQVITKAEDYIKKLSEILCFAGELDGGELFKIARSLSSYIYETKEALAKEFVANNPGIVDGYNRIKNLIEQKDYDSLYIASECDGLPLITSIPNDKSAALPSILKELMSDKSPMENHLRKVAMANVMKRYA